MAQALPTADEFFGPAREGAGSEGSFLTSAQILARNEPYVRAGAQDFQTALSPAQEAQFREWVSQNHVPFNVDSKTPDYDMRGFWLARRAGDPRAKEAIDPNDGKTHFPDYWKTPYDLTFSNQSQWANPEAAPRWNDRDQLVLPNGRIVFDDRNRAPYMLPTADEFFGQRPGPLETTWRAAEGLFNVGANPSVATDDFLRHTAVGRILHAMGQGAENAWGATGLQLSPDVSAFLSKVGIDTESGQKEIQRAFNVGVLRPAAADLYRRGAVQGLGPMAATLGKAVAETAGTYYGMLWRAPAAAFGAFQGLASQAGAELQHTAVGREIGAEALGRDIAAMPTAFMGSPGAAAVGVHGEPTEAPVDLPQAEDLSVVGPGGEAAYAGTASAPVQTPEQVAADLKAKLARIRESGPAKPETPSPAGTAPVPDIHAAARSLAPDAFTHWDELQTRMATFRQWMQELTAKRQTDAEVSAPHASEIADLERRMQTATPRLAKKYAERLANLRPAYDEYVADAVQSDTPDMARVRSAMQKTDYEMRDAAPGIAAAYRQAGGIGSPEPPTPAAPGSAAALVPPSVFDKLPGLEQTKEGGYALDQFTPEEQEALRRAGSVATLRGASGPYDAVDAARVWEMEQQREMPAVPEEVPEEAMAEAQPEPAPEAPVGARPAPIDIARDVALKLESAGRPAEEAEAAGALVAAHYRARAARFLGLKGSAEDLYRAEGPEITGPRGKATVPEREFAQEGERPLFEAPEATPEEMAKRERQAQKEEAEARMLGRKGSRKAQEAFEGTDLGGKKGGQGTLFQGRRGSVTFRDGAATIRLMKNADASTFIHEIGHHWLEELMGDAKDERAPAQLKTDAETVRNWLGAEEDTPISRAQHEKFARGFERYMMEGRAPSQGLARVFAKFKGWLLNIYRTATRLRAPISDDIRAVFDRLLVHAPDEAAVVPESEAAPTLAAVHEADAESTPPEYADEAAERVRDEAEAATRAERGEFADEVAGAASGGPAGGGAPAAQDTGPPGEEGIGPEGTRPPAELGAVDASRDETAPEGTRLRDQTGPYVKIPREPPSLVDFIRREGGLKDDTFQRRINTARGRADAEKYGTDLHAMGARAIRGLIKAKAGRDLDDMALRAWENGYFPENRERPTIREFLDKLSEELAGRKQYSAHDAGSLQAFRDALDHNDEIDRLADHYGIDPNGKTEGQFWDEVAEHASLEEMAHDHKSQADAAEAAMADAEEARGLDLGDAWEADDPYDEGAPRTIKDIEDERRQEQNAGDHRPGDRNPEQPWELGADDTEGEGGAGPRAGGAGARSGHGEEEGRDAGTEDPVVDKAGNIRLDNLNSSEDVNAVLRDFAERNAEFMSARGGVVSDQEVLDFANAMGTEAKRLNLEKIRKAAQADGLPMAAKILGGRQLLIQSAQAVHEAMRSGDEIAYAEAAARHLRIQEDLSAVTAEWGRAGRAFRRMAEESAKAEELTEFLQSNLGKSLRQVKQEMQLGLELDTPEQVSKFVADQAKPDFADKAFEYWMNCLISGPITHATYAVGNALLAFWVAGPESIAAAGIGALRQAFGDEGERVYMGEAPAALFSLLDGVPRGFVAGWKAVKSGMTTALPGEDSAYLALNPGRKAISGIKGEIIRSPSRVIAAIHSFFRAVNYTRAIGQMAYRAAMEEGVTAREDAPAGRFGKVAYRAAEIYENPTPEMMQEASRQATEETLMGKGGDFTRKLAALQNVRVLGVPLKFVMPFVRIASNIAGQGLAERTPLGLLYPEIRERLSGAQGAVMRDTQVARMGLSTALGMAIVGLAAKGLISGAGPSDQKEYALWRLMGNQPYSVRVGDTWYSYHRLGALALPVGVWADAYALGSHVPDETLGHLADTTVASLGRNILDESFMRGPAELIQAIEDPDRYGARWAQDEISSFLPFSVGMSQIARLADPDMREAHGIIQAIKEKTPWFSEKLIPRRDIWGEPIPEGHSLGYVTALYESKVNHDPVNLAIEHAGLTPGMPGHRIRGVLLNDQQYDDYARVAGRLSHARLAALVRTPGFLDLPLPYQREQMAKALYGTAGAREMARKYLLLKYPEIQREAVRAKLALLPKSK